MGSFVGCIFLVTDDQEGIESETGTGSAGDRTGPAVAVAMRSAVREEGAVAVEDVINSSVGSCIFSGGFNFLCL